MTEHIVTYYDLHDDVLRTIESAGAKVTPVKELQPDDYASVTALWTWNWDPEVDNAILNAPGSKLRWIQASSAGVDYLPKQIIAEKGIIVTNASGVHAEPIAQSVLAYMLYFMRGLNTHITNTANHEWNAHNHINRVMSEFNVVVFGTGHIGAELAHNLQAFGVNVTGINHSGRPVDGFNQVAPIADYAAAVEAADIIINILPGTEETRDFFNADFFSHVSDAFLFVNVGRGFSVHNESLINAVADKRVQFVALDVTDPEPLPTDNPLWDIPEVLITSHTTGMIEDYQARLIKIIADNLPSFLADGSFVRNVVDLTKGY